jgi:hypothetical protein
VCQVSRKRLLIYLTNGGVIFNLILILPLFPSTMIRKTYTEDCRCGEHSAATTRLAMVITVPKFARAAAELNLMFSPVAYLTEQQVHTEINTVVENIRTNSEFLASLDRSVLVGATFSMLVAGVACLKHEGFHEEREWRAIYGPKRAHSPFMESSVEIVRGVPQLIYKLPIDETVSNVLAEIDLVRILDRLIIGPSPYPWAMYEAFIDALSKRGVRDAEKKVFTSNIPIRA